MFWDLKYVSKYMWKFTGSGRNPSKLPSRIYAHATARLHNSWTFSSLSVVMRIFKNTLSILSNFLEALMLLIRTNKRVSKISNFKNWRSKLAAVFQLYQVPRLSELIGSLNHPHASPYGSTKSTTPGVPSKTFPIFSKFLKVFTLLILTSKH